jgi:hypothetical protein
MGQPVNAIKRALLKVVQVVAEEVQVVIQELVIHMSLPIALLEPLVGIIAKME